MNKDTKQSKNAVEPKYHRIQFDVPEDLFKRALRYIRNPKYRHYFGYQAFEEQVNRREGRDKKLQTDRIMADAKYLQELIDSGEIKIKE